MIINFKPGFYHFKAKMVDLPNENILLGMFIVCWFSMC